MRLAVLVAVSAAAAGIALVITSASGSTEHTPHHHAADPTIPVGQFLADWHARDYAGMYGLISPQARARVSLARFTALYTRAASVATMRGLHAVGRPRPEGALVGVTMSVDTHRFGRVTEEMAVPLVHTAHGRRVAWTRALTFPGLGVGERLAVQTTVPATRGRILDRSGAILAEGPATARTYPQGSAFADVTGYVKPPSGAQVAARVRAGWPAKLPYGQGGLEESLDPIVGGSPRVALQGVAKATGASHVLAVHPGAAPQDVTTTLRVPIQDAAATALGGRYGGVVVLSAATGAIEADAGLGMDVLQPPGSSFKTITSAAALTAHKTTLETVYPYARYALLNGWKLHNFHHEDCGGSLILSFAVSCNSVFGPLAVSVGGPKLVAMADAFGFNHPASVSYPAPESVTPATATLTSPLDLGVAGIGQGGVEATPLQMASVAQTIGSGCMRKPPYLIRRPLSAREPHAPVQACAREIASQVTTMMEAVVTEGTGRSAAIPGVTVAGKTGTSEIGGPNVPTDAWFIAFAPAGAPKVAVAVLIVKGGVGGDVAAPIAREVLEAALNQ
ncbi:MAG TPA: penicillin-binding transpeptidase domain-containing protein [Gaiellales bacterium]